MRRGEWHDKARAMQAADPDRSMSSIAREIGVTSSAVWKVLNPERTREWVRRDNAARTEYKREWNSRWIRSEAGRGRCSNPACGALLGIGVGGRATHCRSCFLAIAAVRRTITEGMWADGWLLREMADVLDVSSQYFAQRRLTDGWHLPHRYRMVDGRRVADREQVAA